MNYSSFLPQFNDYSHSVHLVQNRREHWQQFTKPILRRMLEETRKALGIDGIVSVNETIHNLESVFLAFNNSFSGLVDGDRDITHSGGYLNFAQTVNGKIMIMIFYPHIEALTPQMPPKQLELIEPEGLSEEIVSRSLKLFFIELFEWQNTYCIQ